MTLYYMSFSDGSEVKNSPANGETQEMRFPSLGREDPQSWQPTPVSLPGEFCAQRNWGGGYSPWDHKSWTRLSN